MLDGVHSQHCLRAVNVRLSLVLCNARRNESFQFVSKYDTLWARSCVEGSHWCIAVDVAVHYVCIHTSNGWASRAPIG